MVQGVDGNNGPHKVTINGENYRVKEKNVNGQNISVFIKGKGNDKTTFIKDENGNLEQLHKDYMNPKAFITEDVKQQRTSHFADRMNSKYDDENRPVDNYKYNLSSGADATYLKNAPDVVGKLVTIESKPTDRAYNLSEAMQPQQYVVYMDPNTGENKFLSKPSEMQNGDKGVMMYGINSETGKLEREKAIVYHQDGSRTETNVATRESVHIPVQEE